MTDAGGIAAKIIAVSVVVMIVAAIIAVTMAPPPVTNPDLASNIGLNDGNTFSYSAAGTFNGSAVVGSLNTSFAQKSWTFQHILTSSHELNDILSSWAPSTVLQMGPMKFATPFGLKDVVCTFALWLLPGGVGMATMSYIGVNPNIAYGFAVNAPGLHLMLTLNQTNNDHVKTDNHNPITWRSPVTGPTPPTQGGSNLNAAWGSHSTWFYAPNGGHIFYNITGEKVDICAFSETNLRSMAEGGPFAYNVQVTRVGAGNESGDAVVPSGLFMIVMGTRGLIEGSYWYSIV
ncbi:MAG: hypothetical protein LUO79_00990 [Methanomassiliicoccales archaeon]|nr:hypothetical protein [Methanomassiliicoccales archaeon]